MFDNDQRAGHVTYPECRCLRGRRATHDILGRNNPGPSEAAPFNKKKYILGKILF